MPVRITYSPAARKDLKKLNQAIVQRIIQKIRQNADLQDPLQRAKALQGNLQDTYRYRIGDYRAIFEYNSDGTIKVLLVLNVKHRKDIYRK